MWFKLLMLVHLSAAFPLKCPEPAQWAQRANGHCTDPSKYFCLKNDLINGYSENCTRSDFQQPGRKAVLRGGIDADICSKERYQPFPIRFYTNVSTHCLFLKSFCNEEGQVVYDHGNRNTDTTCRCDYRRGFDFLVKPSNPCFCKPSQEDCSCYLRNCSNTGHMLSADYQCTIETNHSMEIQCKPTTIEKDNSSISPKIKDNNPVENNISILIQWNKRAATTVAVVLLFISGTMMILFVLFRTLMKRLIWRYCCRVYFISDQVDEITSYEGDTFALKYQLSKRLSDIKIYKDGTLIKSANTLFILNVKIENGGLYHAECHCVRSKYTSLTVLPLTCVSPPEEITAIEGEQVILKYKLPANGILHRLERLSFYKNENICDKPDNIVRHDDGVSFSLSIHNVKQEDEGNYFANVNKFKSNITKLTVQLMFTSEFHLDSIIEGERFELRYSLYSENVDVKWLKNKVEIQSNDNISIKKSGRHHHLTVHNSKLSDSGQYSIVAGNVHKEITVHVKDLFKRRMEDKTVMEGLDINFECETQKTYPAVWYKDGIEVIPSSRIKIETLDKLVYKFTINETTLADKGRYEIRINNILSGAVLDVKEMPNVVKEMSVHDRYMFLKAASTGTAVRYYIRVMIVGESGVGKTCLLRRLMKKDINGVNSTNGINIEVRKCKIDLQKKEWISDSDDDFSLISPYQTQQYADCGFWDFAGQKDFYATHQTFLSTNAIYLLVVDVSKDFSDKTFKDMVEHTFDRSGEYIDFWLDNIHCYGINDENQASVPQTDTYNPPVIIIGTKVDQIQNEKQKKMKSIVELFQHHTNVNHIRGTPYFLSNTEAWNHQQQFKELREQILEVAMDIPKWGDNLPTRWIVLEREIESNIAKKKYIISYEEARQLAEICSFPISKTDSELDSFLKYEHEIGNLIFFDNIKRYIILEPKWLVNIFKCFVSATEFQSEFVDLKEWSQLVSTGILSDSLITKLLEKGVALHSAEQRNFALQIMETFDIIVKHTNKDGKENYYMPCMIKASSYDDIINKFNLNSSTCTRSPWFRLVFKFLPPAFFNHILVSFIKEYVVCPTKDDKPSFYRGIGIFNLDENDCQKLIVCLSKNCVAMQVWEFHHKEQQICFGNYSYVRKHLEDNVDLIQKKYKMNIDYTSHLKCSKGMYDKDAEQIACDGTKMKISCSEHGASHTREELRRTWFDEEKEVSPIQKGDIPVKCHYCEKMPVYRCYECSNVLCDDCYLKHDKLTNTKHHTFQSTNDKLLLNNTFEVSGEIYDMKSLPGGLLVFVVFRSDIFPSYKLLTYSVSDKQRNEISVGKRPYSIAIVDRNTVVVLLSPGLYRKIDSIGIVDIRQRQVIQHVDCTLDLPSYPFCPMFYTDDQLYISNHSGITVMDMSGTIDRKIYLGFKPRDMCYDTKAARIYGIDYSENKLICIDRDGNTIFTFTDTSLTSSERLAIDNEGYVLILCLDDSVNDLKVHRICPDGKSSEVIITGKYNGPYRISSICFQEESDEVVIGIRKKVYTYKNN